ncbi:hypothetical protein NDU88_006100 [Pleurodeles waltl]|uniref:Uncharacterized protein n=1 Tax=Pleurodeles waltl TaxID=8319 RepID=A0AAV7LZ79_PLEWA|nr:hypothetical protein NDU88_006100 [Pleurodeles waltl]
MSPGAEDRAPPATGAAGFLSGFLQVPRSDPTGDGFQSSRDWGPPASIAAPAASHFSGHLRRQPAGNIPECGLAGGPASDPGTSPHLYVKSEEISPGPAPPGGPSKHASPGGQSSSSARQ